MTGLWLVSGWFGWFVGVLWVVWLASGWFGVLQLTQSTTVCSYFPIFYHKELHLSCYIGLEPNIVTSTKIQEGIGETYQTPPPPLKKIYNPMKMSFLAVVTPCTIFVLISYSFDTQVMLILIRIDVQYSQNAVFSSPSSVHYFPAL